MFLFSKHIVRKTTDIKTAIPAILTPTIVPVFCSELNKRDGDGDIEVAMIRLVSSLFDVAGKETGLLDRNLYVLCDDSRVRAGDAVLFVFLIYSELGTFFCLFYKERKVFAYNCFFVIDCFLVCFNYITPVVIKF